jgi:hypothetical protein
MNHYEEKKAARIERMRDRARKLDAISDANGMDIFNERNSGIPLGQPILVGHHSERRHRRHLERLEARLAKGMEAGQKARSLEQQADAAEANRAIDSDNPNAKALLLAKLARLEDDRERFKAMNRLVRKHKTQEALAKAIKETYPKTSNYQKLANSLLTPDFCGRVGVAPYILTNLGAEIRRLKIRISNQDVIVQGFESFTVNDCIVELFNGQLQVEFPYKPNSETRNLLKRSPLALKWSSYSGRWVRKYTATVAGCSWYMTNLKEVLKGAAE